MPTSKQIAAKQVKNSDRKIHPNSVSAIKKHRWKKGIPSPNPKGRPPGGWSWAEIIREYGDKDCPSQYAKTLGLKENPKWKEVVIAMAFRHAAEGNASILRTLVEYVEGRAPLVNVGNIGNSEINSVIVLPEIVDHALALESGEA